MISNERPSPYGHSGHRPHPQHSSPKPPVVEETIRTDKVQIERKSFVFTLKENPRGRFLRITEDVNGRRDTIIIPATGLDEFKRLFEDMLQASIDTPLKTPSPME
jgi:PurA ssDNA and RNA-binding protein